MKIAIISAFYSEGMGYAENCLPKFLALNGNEVHVVTSEFNVYGNSFDYGETYEPFLGPARQPVGTFETDGYLVHRLPTSMLGGYVRMRGLGTKLRELAPAVVHSMEIASLQTFSLAMLRLRRGFRLFAETHQHLSVVKPYMTSPRGPMIRRLAYRLTRTLPTSIASLAVKRCYAIAPDCALVAHKYYGVPKSKIVVQSLGTDTELFRPAEAGSRAPGTSLFALRNQLGFGDREVVCIYTGRFSRDKNPLLLAQAVEILAEEGQPFRALFIGDGVQREAIAACRRSVIVPFMKQCHLADYYRVADIAVWPTQESMSMLDAAASGLPIVVSNRIGERERVDGNGSTYSEGDVRDLACALEGLSSSALRNRLGAVGRAKALERFSWSGVASRVEGDYRS